jgi:drug/metabolite transporter (DMT)-like permease
LGNRVTVGRESPSDPSTSALDASATPSAAPRRRLASVRTWAFAAVYLIWGSTYLGIRIGVESIPPFLLGGARFFIAGSLLFVWALARGARRPSALEWRRASVAGVAMLAGGNGLVTLAETHVPSSLAALMIAGVPAYVLLLDWARPGGTRPSRQALLGILIGSLGMMLLVRPGARDLEPNHWYGVAALALAGWCWAFGSLCSRYLPQHPSSAMAGAQQMMAGGGTMLLVALGRGELAKLVPSEVSARSLGAFVYLTVFGSLVAFSAYNWLVLETSPAQLSTTAYVNPVVALVLGWVVLGETLHPLSLAGAALIVAAVVVMLTRIESRAIRPSTSGAAPPPPPRSSAAG